MVAMRRPALAEALGLQPHPEGGWYRETWSAPVRFTPEGYPGSRASATGIYFLLYPGEESAWHRVRGDEVWLWHQGAPLLLSIGGTGERPADTVDTMLLGPDVAAGQHPQAVVPGGHWQSARPAGTEQVLVSCIVSPGFDFADFTLL